VGRCQPILVEGVEDETSKEFKEDSNNPVKLKHGQGVGFYLPIVNWEEEMLSS
jgi:hypothetical protein